MFPSSYVFKPVIPLPPIEDDDEDEWLPSSSTSNSTSPLSTTTSATTPGTTDSESGSNGRKRKRLRSRNFLPAEKQGLFEIVSKYKETMCRGGLDYITKTTWGVISNEFHLRFGETPKRSTQVLKSCWTNMCRSREKFRRAYTIFKTPKTNAVEIRVDTGMAYKNFCEEDIEIYTGRNVSNVGMNVLPNSPAAPVVPLPKRPKQNPTESDPLEIPMQPIGIPSHVPSFCESNQGGVGKVKLNVKVSGPRSPTPPYKCRQRKVRPPSGENVSPPNNSTKPELPTVTNTTAKQFPSTTGLPDLLMHTKKNTNFPAPRPIPQVKYYISREGVLTTNPKDAQTVNLKSLGTSNLRNEMRGGPLPAPVNPENVATRQYIIANWKGRISASPMPPEHIIASARISEPKSKVKQNCSTTIGPSPKPLPNNQQVIVEPKENCSTTGPMTLSNHPQMISKSKENCRKTPVIGGGGPKKQAPPSPSVYPLASKDRTFSAIGLADDNLKEAVKNHRMQLFLKAQQDLQRLKAQVAQFQRTPAKNILSQPKPKPQ